MLILLGHCERETFLLLGIFGLLLRLHWLMRIGFLEVQFRTGGLYWVVALRVLGLFDLVVLGFPRFVVMLLTRWMR